MGNEGSASLLAGFDTRMEAELDKAAAAYDSQLSTTTDPRLKQDLQILAGAARDQVNTSRLNRKLMLPFFDLPQMLFGSFDALLDPRVDKARYPAALERLKRYTGRESGYKPITEQLQARIAERFETTGLTGPSTVEVQQSLDNQQRFVDGIREDFKRSGLKAGSATSRSSTSNSTSTPSGQAERHAARRQPAAGEICANNLHVRRPRRSARLMQQR